MSPASHDEDVTVLTWNVNRRINVAPQAEFIARFDPDVVALQEVIGRSEPLWREALLAMGYRFIDSTLDLVKPEDRKGPRQYLVLTASKASGRRIATTIPVAWPERLLVSWIDGLGYFVTMHAPPGVTNGWRKIETLEHVWDIVCDLPKGSCVVTGDLNAPQTERADGTVTTWAERIRVDGSTRVISSRGERWDRAERRYFESLAEVGLQDAFRAMHGYEAQGHSWAWRGKGRFVPYRFDHIFVGGHHRVVEFQYVHEAVELGLSDHSPGVARLVSPLGAK